MYKTLVLGLLVVAFDARVMAGSIDIGLPLNSADVSTPATHENLKGRRDLTPAQLQSLTHWLEQHKSGWRGEMLPETNEQILLVVRLFPSRGWRLKSF
jgi:hypothetical protein